jgi:steroid delta-isomerase-like uncharacterized protein
VPEILTEDIRFRGSLGQEKNGHDQFCDYVRFIQNAFPDFHNRINDIVCDGERCFCRLTYTGTHKGEIFGIPATDRKIEYSGAALFDFRDSKISTVWVLGDVFGLLQQLGDCVT